MEIVGVRSADIDRIADRIAWHLDSFAERSRGRTTPERLLRNIRERDVQCWLAVEDGEIRAVALTRVQKSEKTDVEMTHCAGSGREGWQREMVRTVMAWAREIGADGFRAVCRPGWTKMLRDEGLRETHRVLEIDL